MRGQYGEMMSVGYSFMNARCESMVTEVSRTWKSCNSQGGSWNWAVGSNPYKDEGLWDLSGISEKKKAHVWLPSFIAASSHFFYDHRFSPHVIGHIKAIQRFRFCFNSKFTCSSCLCTMFLSIALSDMFLILSWASPLRCPRNTQPSSSKQSGLIWLFTVYLYHLFESLFTAYKKWG